MKSISIVLAILPICILLSADGIISMAPNITETIFFLGTDSVLVGRTAYCNYPEAAGYIPIIGSFISMNYESVLALDPDTILFSDNLIPTREVFCIQHNIRCIDIAMKDMESVFTGMKDLAEMTGSERDIDSFINESRHLIDGYSADSNSIKVYIEVGTSPLVAAGSESYIGSILEAMNYRIFSFTGDYMPLNQEDIINSNPDIIIIMSGASNPKERNGWEHVKAVKENNIIILDQNEVDVMSRPGPRIIEAIKIMGEHLNEINI